MSWYWGAAMWFEPPVLLGRIERPVGRSCYVPQQVGDGIVMVMCHLIPKELDVILSLFHTFLFPFGFAACNMSTLLILWTSINSVKNGTSGSEA